MLTDLAKIKSSRMHARTHTHLQIYCALGTFSLSFPFVKIFHSCPSLLILGRSSKCPISINQDYKLTTSRLNYLMCIITA